MKILARPRRYIYSPNNRFIQPMTNWDISLLNVRWRDYLSSLFRPQSEHHRTSINHEPLLSNHINIQFNNQDPIQYQNNQELTKSIKIIMKIVCWAFGLWRTFLKVSPTNCRELLNYDETLTLNKKSRKRKKAILYLKRFNAVLCTIKNNTGLET